MEEFSRYCDAVCRRVHYPFVRKAIRSELTGHLEDRTQALFHQGHPQDEAARLAVAAMGDPEETGRALNRLYPPFWHWLTRCLALFSLLLVLVLASTALSYTLEDVWNYYNLLPQDYGTAQEYLEDQLLTTHGWDQRVIARGRVTGGGRLGDYTFTPETEARVIDTPAFVQNGYPRGGYQSLEFILTVTHPQPWLPGLTPEWALPTLTDGAGIVYRGFDPDNRLQVSAAIRAPLTDYVYCRLTDPDLTQTEYTFTLTGPDGRVLPFHITLDQWEELP